MTTKAHHQLSIKLIAAAAAVLFAAAAPSVSLALTQAVSAAQTQGASAGAAQQSNNSRDLTITRNIRRTIVKDKSLSTDAHNVTIITKDGKVTLKGRVRSEAEKQTVETAATNVAGQLNVDDQLTTNSQ